MRTCHLLLLLLLTPPLIALSCHPVLAQYEYDYQCYAVYAERRDAAEETVLSCMWKCDEAYPYHLEHKEARTACVEQCSKAKSDELDAAAAWLEVCYAAVDSEERESPAEQFVRECKDAIQALEDAAESTDDPLKKAEACKRASEKAFQCHKQGLVQFPENVDALPALGKDAYGESKNYLCYCKNTIEDFEQKIEHAGDPMERFSLLRGKIAFSVSCIRDFSSPLHDPYIAPRIGRDDLRETSNPVNNCEPIIDGLKAQFDPFSCEASDVTERQRVVQNMRKVAIWCVKQFWSPFSDPELIPPPYGMDHFGIGDFYNRRVCGIKAHEGLDDASAPSGDSGSAVLGPTTEPTADVVDFNPVRVPALVSQTPTTNDLVPYPENFVFQFDSNAGSVLRAFVVRVDGSADMQMDGVTRVPVARGLELLSGSHVFVADNSALQIQFSTHVLIELHANSELAIEYGGDDSGAYYILLQLMNGSLRVRVEKGEMETSVTIATPGASASITGTDAGIAYDAGRHSSIFEAYDGIMAIKRPQSDDVDTIYSIYGSPISRIEVRGDSSAREVTAIPSSEFDVDQSVISTAPSHKSKDKRSPWLLFTLIAFGIASSIAAVVVVRKWHKNN